MPTRTTLFILALLPLTVSPTRSSDHTKEIVKGALGARLDEYLTRIMPFGFSGALLVAKNGEVILNKGYGLAIRDRNIPNTSETIFCIGSITKQFTAAAIMTLEKQGKLKTEDPITKYFEGVPPDKSSITLHHLLTHTSGLVPDVGGDYDRDERDETVRKILALPLEFSPGDRFEYSNVNYTLLAAIIEKVSGQPYEQYIHGHLFMPAGMQLTGYRIPTWDEHVVAHWYVGDQDNANPLMRPFPYWNLIGNGGILSTTDDMYRWHLALLGEKILSADAKKKLFTPFLNEYAYGWDVLRTDRGTLIQHNGGSELGNSAEVRRYIDSNVVTVLLCNQRYNQRALIDVVRDKIESIVFGREVTVPSVVTTGDPTTLKSFEGAYVLPSGARFEVSVKSAGLLVKPVGQDALTLLVFPDGVDTNLIRRVTESSAKIFGGALKGDYTPFGQAMLNREKRLPLVRGLIERRVKEANEQTGGIQSAEVLGTFPSPREKDALMTAVALRGERGSIYFQSIWRGVQNIGVGPLDDAPQLEMTFMPVSTTEFVGYDLGMAKIVRMAFALDGRDSVKTLTIQGRGVAAEAKRVTE